MKLRILALAALGVCLASLLSVAADQNDKAAPAQTAAEAATQAAAPVPAGTWVVIEKKVTVTTGGRKFGVRAAKDAEFLSVVNIGDQVTACVKTSVVDPKDEVVHEFIVVGSYERQTRTDLKFVGSCEIKGKGYHVFQVVK